MNRDEMLYEQMSELYDIAMEGIFQKMRDKKLEKQKAENESFLREKIQSGDIYRHTTNAELQKVIPYIRKEVSKITRDPNLKSYINKFQSKNPGLKIEILQNPKITTNEYDSDVMVFNNAYKIVDAIVDKYQGIVEDAEEEELAFERAITRAVSNIVESLKKYPELKEYFFEVLDLDHTENLGIFRVIGIRVKDISELDNERYIRVTNYYRGMLSKRSDGLWK